jgi:hypothetical protein
VRPLRRKRLKPKTFAHREELTFDGIVKRQDVNSFAVFDVVASVNVDDIAELDAQVVSRHCFACSKHIQPREQKTLPLFI